MRNAFLRGLQTFLPDGYIIYYKTVRGPGILRNVIFSVYVTFYQINKCFVITLFFRYWENFAAAGWNDFAGRIWSAGRSLATLIW